jgi:hypothetical protein
LGQYTLTALPDGDTTKQKVVKFNIVPGTVIAVKLWDNVSKTVLNSNFTGGNVCNRKTVAFEAVMPLADTSKMTLTSTNGFSSSSTESTAPFSISNNFGGVFFGNKLSNGAYTFTFTRMKSCRPKSRPLPSMRLPAIQAVDNRCFRHRNF